MELTVGKIEMLLRERVARAQAEPEAIAAPIAASTLAEIRASHGEAALADLLEQGDMAASALEALADGLSHAEVGIYLNQMSMAAGCGVATAPSLLARFRPEH